MFGQSAAVTSSPHHWCASSCETSPSHGLVTFAQGAWIANSVWVVVEAFSMPPAVKRSTVVWSYLSHGYVTPMMCWKYATMSLVLPKHIVAHLASAAEV